MEAPHCSEINTHITCAGLQSLPALWDATLLQVSLKPSAGGDPSGSLQKSLQKSPGCGPRKAGSGWALPPGAEEAALHRAVHQGAARALGGGYLKRVYSRGWRDPASWSAGDLRFCPTRTSKGCVSSRPHLVPDPSQARGHAAPSLGVVSSAKCDIWCWSVISSHPPMHFKLFFTAKTQRRQVCRGGARRIVRTSLCRQVLGAGDTAALCLPVADRVDRVQ